MENDPIERQSARDVIYSNLVANQTEYTLDFRRGMAYASSLLILEPPAVDAVEVSGATKRAVELIIEERRRQITEWGDQSDRPLFEFMSILGEEFGEQSA